MQHRIIPLYMLMALMPPTALISATPTAQTFFKQSNAPHWFTSEALPFNYAKKPHTKTVHSAFTITGFYSRSADKKRLGDYFGFYDDATATTYPFLRVTADTTIPSSLLPQDIVHNAAQAAHFDVPANNPFTETITFNPRIENFGLIFANALQINKWITVHTIMPWMQTRHSMGMVSSGVTKTIVEDSFSSPRDFFTGALHQEEAASPNQQDRLLYGKLTNNQSISGLADITLMCLFTPHINEHIEVDIGPLVTIPTCSRPHGIFLFEPILGTASHTLLGFHGRARTEIGRLKLVTFTAAASSTVRIGITSQEIRSPSFLINYSNGVDAQFGRYALGGKQYARRLFPMINMLTQMVNVTPGSTIEGELQLSAHYKTTTLSAEYRFTHTGSEKVVPLVAWPNNTYALSRLSYAQTDGHGVTNTFDIQTNSALINNAPINENAINFAASQTPVQKTHTLACTFQCVPLTQFPYSSVHVRMHYAFATSKAFGIGGYGIGCSLSHTF